MRDKGANSQRGDCVLTRRKDQNGDGGARWEGWGPLHTPPPPVDRCPGRRLPVHATARHYSAGTASYRAASGAATTVTVVSVVVSTRLACASSSATAAASSV